MKTYSCFFQIVLLLLSIIFGTSNAALATTCNVPPFTQTNTPANVLILYDTSASMRETIDALAKGSKQISGETYYPGDFDYTTTYAAYTTTSGKTFSAGKVYDAYENEVSTTIASFSPSGLNNTVKNWMRDNLTKQGWSYKNHPNRNAGWYNVGAYYSGNYLNFLHASSMRDDVGRSAIYDLVNNTTGVSFGLMAYKFRGTSSDDNDLGGLMIAPISTDKTALLAAISSYSGDVSDSSNNSGLIMNAFGQTPIAKQLKDAATYFESGFTNPDNTVFPTPLDETCEKSFVIIVTDGYPTGGDMTEANVTNECNPNNYVDTDDDKAADDLAGCYYETDLSAMDETQNLITYTIGFGGVSGSATDLLVDSAANGRGAYFNAENASQLQVAFESIITSIQARAASGTAASVVSSTGEGEDRILRASFHPTGWMGFMEAFELESYTSSSLPLWQAGELMETASASSRTIYTVTDSDADSKLDDLADFRDSFSSADIDDFKADLNVSDSDINDLINYLRGEDNRTDWRTRDEDGDGNIWKLGDIVNSSPVVVGGPPFFFSEHDYASFQSTYKDRDKVAYVGSGNGMLEAFNLADGTERWGMIPNMLLGKVKELTDIAYCRLAYVDNTPKLLDAYITYEDSGGSQLTDWRTMLIQGLREGGSGYFAVDITDPSQAPNPLWEYPGLGTLSYYQYSLPGDYDCEGVTLCTDSSSPIEVSTTGTGTASLNKTSVSTVWWDNSFPYRRQITVTNTEPLGNSLNDHPVHIDFAEHYELVSSGKSRSDGDDVRVVFCTDTSTCNEIHRVPKKIWNSNDVSVEVWFEVQATISPASSDDRYYLYYGNLADGQTPLSFCGFVFEHCEQFNTDGGTPSGWTATGGTWTVSNGILNSDTDSGITEELYRTDWTNPAWWATEDKVIMVDLFSESGGEYQNGHIAFDWQTQNNWKWAGARDGADEWRIGYYDGSWRNGNTQVENISSDQWYVITARINGDTVSFYRDHALMLSHTFTAGQGGLMGTGGVGVANERALVKYDNLTVHRYKSYIPAVALGTEVSLYPTDNPTITTKAATVLSYTTLTSFSAGYGTNHAGEVKFQISSDGSTWYWYNSVTPAWEDVSGSGYLKSSTATEINSQISNFPDTVGAGDVYVKAFFNSDGSQKVELDWVGVGINTGTSNLGESWSIPATGKMLIGTTDTWTMAVGSGPGNADTKGYTFVHDISDGSLIWSDKVSDDTGNQMTSAEVVDSSNNGYINKIFVNDLKGKMYRYDVSDSSSSNWAQLDLLNAGTSQPFTAPSVIASDANSDVWAFAGTGRYLAASDASTTEQQAFYGVKDAGIARTPTDLTVRDVETDSSSGTTVVVPTATSTCDTDAATNGWYFNLPQSGERVLSKGVVASGVLFFTSFVPTTSSCSFGGDAFLYALDYDTGCPLDTSVIDVTGDGSVDSSDTVSGEVVIGLKIATGVPSAPQIAINSAGSTGSNASIVTQTSSTEINITDVLLPEAGAKLESWKEN